MLQIIGRALIAAAVFSGFGTAWAHSHSHTHTLNDSSVFAAESIRGVLLKRGGSGGTNDLYLVSKSWPQPLKIVVSTPTLNVDLGNLKDGDFLVARGLASPSEGTVRVDAIESLGLRELLGSWRTDRWEVYEFRDFNRMNLYVPTRANNGQRVPLSMAREFNYVLAPEQGARYSIFLSDDRTVTVGTIEVQENKINFIVYDSKTGEVSQNISLSPLSL
jgi:hypothetical protein